MAYPYEGGITCLSNHGTTEYTEYPPVWARNTRKAALLWRIGGQETSSVYSVCSVVLYPKHIRAGGTTAPRNTRNGLPVWVRDNLPFQPWHHGIHGIPARMGTEYPEGGIIVAHWGARNIVCVFCVFSGPLSATHSGWGAPRHHGIPGMAYPYEGGITCLSNHGTTEYTEYPPVWARNTRKAALLWRIGGQETSSVYSVCSVVLLSATHSGWGAPRHHGIPGIHRRRLYCGALGARNIVCVFCVFSGPLSATYSGWGGTTEYPPVWARKVVVNGLS